jgi:hypothetical protein
LPKPDKVASSVIASYVELFESTTWLYSEQISTQPQAPTAAITRKKIRIRVLRDEQIEFSLKNAAETVELDRLGSGETERLSNTFSGSSLIKFPL